MTAVSFFIHIISVTNDGCKAQFGAVNKQGQVFAFLDLLRLQGRQLYLFSYLLQLHVGLLFIAVSALCRITPSSVGFMTAPDTKAA